MPFSLCQLARSRRLRVMAALAWLLLVVNAAMPMATAAGSSVHVAHALVGTHTGKAPMPHTACDDGHAGCCGGQLSPGCHCAAMSGGLLLPVFAAMPGAMAMAVVPERPLPRHAPSPTASPPLRPPAT
ncbi:hypothetical protein [Rhodanobacter sp. C06]|uniref:hypothetical protein n=1 Tax=Rhodanobacter sp. C06 TaxID=1945854 RepID=UPI00111599EB|nr:hypothetical protein [Rhodanobacter sp. C06]